NGLSEENVLADAREKLKNDYDVIIIGNVNWDILPESLVYEILKKISKGCGLVICSFDIKQEPTAIQEYFTETSIPAVFENVPLEVIIKPYSNDIIRTYTFNKGRIVLFHFQKICGPNGIHSITVNPKDPLHYEYAQALLIKTILWAANKEPDLSINKMSLPVETVVRENLPISFSVELNNQTHSERGIKTKLTIRDEKNEVENVITKDLELQNGVQTISFSLPILKAGGHYMDLLLEENGQIVNWSSTFFKVTAQIVIDEVRLDKEYYRLGEVAHIKILLDSVALEEQNLEVLIIDNFERQVAGMIKKLNVGQKESDFEYPVENILTIVNRVQVNLYPSEEHGGILSRQETILFVPTIGQEDFILGAWVKAGGEHLFEQLGHYMWQKGFDSVMFLDSPTTNMRPFPMAETTYYSGSSNVREPCLTNPVYRQKAKQQVQSMARRMAKWGPAGYSLGDEPNLSIGAEVCLSPTCQVDFQEYLKRQYKDIEKLNKEWSAGYNSWAEIKPMLQREADEKGNLVPWMDFRLHMDEVMTKHLVILQKDIQEVDPVARVGIEGIFEANTYLGIDWYELSTSLRVIMPYIRIGHDYLAKESVRSFATRQSLTGTWYGSYPDNSDNLPFLQIMPWHQLFHNSNSIWWFSPYNYTYSCTGYEGIFPDFRLTPGLEASLKEINEIKKGIGKLILNAERLHDGIAVLYSKPSLYRYGTSSEELLPILEDLGYQYEMISDVLLEQGGLSDGKYKVFILPTAVSLSGKEVAEIKKFVYNGGILISDLSPAVYDEHGKALSSSALNDVLGITGEVRTIGKREAIVDISKMGLKSFRTTEYNHITIATGTAYGRIDGTILAIVINKYGKGQSILLNFRMNDYIEERRKGEGMSKQECMDKLLTLCGLKSPVQIKLDSGGRLQGCEVIRYSDGTGEYIGLLKEKLSKDEGAKKVGIFLPRTGHLYDVREKQYIGPTDRTMTEITPGRVKVYAMMPYKIEGVVVKPDESAVEPGEKFHFQIIIQPSEGKKTGKHVVHIEVFDPDGQTRRYYGKNLILEKGQGLYYIPLALNEQKGTWKVVVTEIVSGQKREIDFEVIR
ncbi:MAG: beta-galactosidase, partial [Planctomycetes bacterium]|nr:beta-galactosidase [Planctomycetota bacterium]